MSEFHVTAGCLFFCTFLCKVPKVTAFRRRLLDEGRSRGEPWLSAKECHYRFWVEEPYCVGSAGHIYGINN